MLRNPSLDVLRGGAVLFIVLFHVNVPFFNKGGWIGVDLFFVLSGFLISGLLFHDFQKLGKIRLGRFWFRRAFKILPPLYVFLAAMGTLMLSFHFFTGKAFASTLFFYSTTCRILTAREAPLQTGRVNADSFTHGTSQQRAHLVRPRFPIA